FVYRVHCYLHSFPTRRSSDLQLKWGRIICFFSSSVRSYSCKNFNGLFMSCPRTAGSKCALTLISRNTSRDIYVLPLVLVSSFYRDRKSTRLNSSHGSISYAVF